MTRRRLIQVVAALAVVTAVTAYWFPRKTNDTDTRDAPLATVPGASMQTMAASAVGMSAMSVPKSGLLDFWILPVAAGPVHADWPLIVAAEIPGPMGWEARQEQAARVRADEFAAPPAIEPPNGRRPEWQRQQGFIVAGPPGSADDRFEVAEVALDGRAVTVTVTVEGWRSGRPVAARDLRRPTQVVTIVPQLQPGEYDLTVVWRDFRPARDREPFWSLSSVQTGTTKLTVYPDDRRPERGPSASKPETSDGRGSPRPRQPVAGCLSLLCARWGGSVVFRDSQPAMVPGSPLERSTSRRGKKTFTTVRNGLMCHTTNSGGRCHRHRSARAHGGAAVRRRIQPLTRQHGPMSPAGD